MATPPTKPANPRPTPKTDPADNAPGASSGKVKAGDQPVDPPQDDVAPGSQPASNAAPTVNLRERGAPSDARLPHEADQAPDSQEPDQAQNRTAEARTAYQDAARGHPDTGIRPALEEAEKKLRDAP